jgi:hypothetical protein
VNRFRKAVAITAVSAAAILAILVHATLSAERPLTANEVRLAAHRVLADLGREAVNTGGLPSAEAAAESRLSEALRVPVTLWRPPRPWREPPLAFLVTAGGVETWVSPEGLPDPLAAIRRGELALVRVDPHTPSATHRLPEVLLDCIARGYAHPSLEAPDFFARLENRTASDGHGGYEILLAERGLALDRFALAGLPTPEEALRPYR